MYFSMWSGHSFGDRVNLFLTGRRGRGDVDHVGGQNFFVDTIFYVCVDFLVRGGRCSLRMMRWVKTFRKMYLWCGDEFSRQASPPSRRFIYLLIYFVSLIGSLLRAGEFEQFSSDRRPSENELTLTLKRLKNNPPPMFSLLVPLGLEPPKKFSLGTGGAFPCVNTPP